MADAKHVQMVTILGQKYRFKSESYKKYLGCISERHFLFQHTSMYQIFTMKTIQVSLFIRYFKIFNQLAIILYQLFSEYAIMGIVFIVIGIPYPTTVTHKVTYVTQAKCYRF